MTDDTLPPAPGTVPGITILALSPDEELDKAICIGCGALGCRSAISDAAFVRRSFCAKCEPAEIADMRLATLFDGINETFVLKGLVPGEALSVLALLMHSVAHSMPDENLDTLQEGLRAAEVKFHELFPDLPAKPPSAPRAG